MVKIKKGFTLVELVIVIAVIAILSAVLLPVFSGMMENARESSRYQQASNARKELVTAEGYLPEKTVGMVISVDDKSYYIITEDGGLQPVTIRSKSLLNELNIETISNKNIKVYDKIESNTLYNGEKYILYGISYKETTSSSNIIYADFEEVSPDTFFDIENNELTLKSEYTQRVVDVSLPHTITSIGDNAFYNCSYLSKVIFNSDVTNIGSKAFYNCRDLDIIYLPDSVETIGDNAFYNCRELIKMYIPDKVQTINQNTFNNCTGLTDLYIGNSVSTVGTNAFYNVKALTKLVIGDNLTNFNNIPISNFKATLETVVIGKGIKALEEKQFYQATKLESITFKGELESIGKQCFYGASKLSHIDLPSSVNLIDQEAFANCDALTNIEIPENTTLIYPKTFYDCNNLATVKFLGNVTNIGANAFEYCRVLEKVTFVNSDTLESIGSNAFYSCNKLPEPILPKNLKLLGSYAFYYCKGFTSPIVIPSGIESIGAYAFGYCENVDTLIVEDGVYDSAFEQYAMQRFEPKIIKLGNNITSLSNFYIRYATSVELGTAFTEIPDKAFDTCTSLTTVITHAEITRIGDYAFNWCWNLADFIIPETVTSIGAYAFCNTDITEAFIPATMTEIPEGIFSSCAYLTKVDVKGNITSIGKKAFYMCGNLTQVNMLGENNITYIGEEAFSQDKKLNFTINCLNGAIIERKAFDQCYYLYGEVAFHDDMTEIGESTFNEAHYISSIVIGKNIQSIGRYAFDNCGRTSGSTPVKIFYKGSMEDWRNIVFEASNYGSGSGKTCNKPRYYYLENAPTQEDWDKLTSDKVTNTTTLQNNASEAIKGSGEKGYWHYDSNNQIVIWQKN